MLIKRLLFILAFVFISKFSLSQKCAIVSESQTKVGVAYATVALINKPNGTIADERGNFCLEIPYFFMKKM